MTDTTTTPKTIDQLVLEFPEEKVVTPTIPVLVVIGEAAKLHSFATEDKEALSAKGLTQEKIDDLTPRIQYLQDRQSDWRAVYESALSSTEDWEAKIDEASLLQKELKYDFLFAYRDQPEILKKAKKITEGSGHLDLIQDMSDYAAFGKLYPEPLAKINFDTEKLERANNLSHELIELMEKVDGVKNSADRPEKELRDRAYTYLKQLVDEIRAYGKYAFWNDEKKRKRYTSEYIRLNNVRNSKTDEVEN